MAKTRLMLVAGARPNFMKIAPIIRECRRRSQDFEYKLVHTGQHYDTEMSDVFFDELDIPRPDFYLNAGGGNHSEQTANVMAKFHPICEAESPDSVIVVGDVNSTLACAIVAKKLHKHVAHVEAGLRSGDRAMPEEINRIATDAISDDFFVTEESGKVNLLAEGHVETDIHFVGHVMIDNLFYEEGILRERNLENVPEAIDFLEGRKFAVVTLHRPSNVDTEPKLRNIVEALNQISEHIDIVFPVHPRTRGKLDEFGILTAKNLHCIGPLSYRNFLRTWRNAAFVLTDSGGLQEETTALSIQCLTLRDTTERPITIESGSNKLVGTNQNDILSAALDCISNPKVNSNRPPLWDGKASQRILDVLLNKGLGLVDY